MSRRFTREVFVGNIGVGGNNPIRIQSMTTTDTGNVEETVIQIKEMVDAGCEIVRVTVQGIKEAYACGEIKDRLLQDKYDVPLVADIHFFPPAALCVADFVEKIRINPGNFSERRNLFAGKQYQEEDYAIGLERLENKFIPLVEKCKKLKRSLRIGVNHGSLSERIMYRYGDTINGMVESALEFIHVSRKYNYHDIIISMKSSIPQVMIEAYEALCERFDLLGFNYPLHLGVTEAGFGIDGRVKSGIGIGSLLLKGFGDTIRASFTENPVNEIPACKSIINVIEKNTEEHESLYNHVPSIIMRDIGALLRKNKFPVFLDLSITDYSDHLIKDLGIDVDNSEQLIPDAIIVNIKDLDPSLLRLCKDAGISVYDRSEFPFPVLSQEKDLHDGAIKSSVMMSPIIFVQVNRNNYDDVVELCKTLASIDKQGKVILIYTEPHENANCLSCSIGALCGSILLNNNADGIMLESSMLTIKEKIDISFALLQGTRKRVSKTEFISCPGCGRTLFNIQDVVDRVKAKLSNLPGLKIAIMGCIVNGPGEMADADFGVVGAGSGKVDLYIKHNKVKAGIDINSIEVELIALLKDNGVLI